MGFWGPDRQFSTNERKQGQMDEYDDLQSETGQSGRAGRSAFLERSLAFDPSEAVTEWGGGFMENATEDLDRSFQKHRGEAVGRGRMNTGFMQEDGKQMFQDFNKRVANAIAMQSMNAASMQMQNTQGLGSFGQNMMGQQVDLLAGAMDRSTAEDNSRTSPADMIAQVGGMALGRFG